MNARLILTAVIRLPISATNQPAAVLSAGLNAPHPLPAATQETATTIVFATAAFRVIALRIATHRLRHLSRPLLNQNHLFRRLRRLLLPAALNGKSAAAVIPTVPVTPAFTAVILMAAPVELESAMLKEGVRAMS